MRMFSKRSLIGRKAMQPNDWLLPLGRKPKSVSEKQE